MAKMTSAGELRRLRDGISRRAVLTSRTRLLCPSGHGVQNVVDVFSGGVAKLACHCRREIEEGLKTQIAKLEQEVERDVERAKGMEEA
jgi:hypothetical protein